MQNPVVQQRDVQDARKSRGGGGKDSQLPEDDLVRGDHSEEAGGMDASVRVWRDCQGLPHTTYDSVNADEFENEPTHPTHIIMISQHFPLFEFQEIRPDFPPPPNPPQSERQATPQRIENRDVRPSRPDPRGDPMGDPAVVLSRRETEVEVREREG